MNAERRQNIYSYTATRLCMTVMYKLWPCVSQSHCQCHCISQSSKSSTAQQVTAASCADSLSSLLHIGIGHRQISVSIRRQ